MINFKFKVGDEVDLIVRGHRVQYGTVVMCLIDGKSGTPTYDVRSALTGGDPYIYQGIPEGNIRIKKVNRNEKSN